MPGFTLKGKVQLDGSQWRSGLAQAEREGSQFATRVSRGIRSKLAAAFAVGTLLRAGNSAISRGGEVRDRSRALGISPELFQQIDFAASQSGASIDDAAKAIRRLAIAQSDAKRGSKDVLEAFNRYGVTIENLKRLSPDKLFFLISEQVEKGVNKANQLADIQRLLGSRGGANLIPAFESGFGRAAQDALDLNTVIATKDIMTLARAGDELLTKRRQAGVALAESISAAGSAGGAGLNFFEKHASNQGFQGMTFGAQMGQLNKLQKQQLDAIIEMKQAARETANNTKPLNE